MEKTYGLYQTTCEGLEIKNWACAVVSPYSQGQIIENANNSNLNLKFYFPSNKIGSFVKPIYPEYLFVSSSYPQEIKIWSHSEKEVLGIIKQSNGQIATYKEKELPQSPHEKIVLTTGEITEIIAGPLKGSECKIQEILDDAVLITLLGKGLSADIFLQPRYLGLFSPPPRITTLKIKLLLNLRSLGAYLDYKQSFVE